MSLLSLALVRHTLHNLPRSSLERSTAPRVHKLVKVSLRTNFGFWFLKLLCGECHLPKWCMGRCFNFSTVKHSDQIKYQWKVLWCLNFVSRSKSEYHVWLFASVWRLGFFADFKLFGVRWPNRIGFAELATLASFTSRLVSFRSYIHPWEIAYFIFM